MFSVTREEKSQVGRYCYHLFVNTTHCLSHTCTVSLFFFKSPDISKTSNTMSWMTTIRFTCKFQHPRVLATVALLDWNLQIFIFFNSARYPFQQLVNRSRNFFKELIRTGGEGYSLPFTFFSRKIFFLRSTHTCRLILKELASTTFLKHEKNYRGITEIISKM